MYIKNNLQSAYLGLRYVEYLIQKENIFKGKRVLDLSAGCGLLGISIGLLGANVIVSERGDAQLHLLNNNVNKNKEQIIKNGGTIKVLDYSWGDDISEEFDYIFMCDLLYIVVRDDLQDYFKKTLHLLIKNSDNYLVYEERVIDKEQLFINELKKDFLFNTIPIKEEWMIDVFYYIIKQTKSKSEGEFSGLSDMFEEYPQLNLYKISKK